MYPVRKFAKRNREGETESSPYLQDVKKEKGFVLQKAGKREDSLTTTKEETHQRGTGVLNWSLSQKR